MHGEARYQQIETDDDDITAILIDHTCMLESSVDAQQVCVHALGRLCGSRPSSCSAMYGQFMLNHELKCFFCDCGSAMRDDLDAAMAVLLQMQSGDIESGE